MQIKKDIFIVHFVGHFLWKSVSPCKLMNCVRVAQEKLRVPVNFFIAFPFIIHLRNGIKLVQVHDFKCVWRVLFKLLRTFENSPFVFSLEIFLFIPVLYPPRDGYLTLSFLFYVILRVCENNRRCDLLRNKQKRQKDLNSKMLF